MPAYRKTLALSFLFKFFVSAAREFRISLNLADDDDVDSIHRQPSTSTRDNSDPYALETVGQQLPHNSGLKQVTGEAVYTDDMPSLANEGHLALVLSSRAHAKILSVDPSAALDQDGVISYIDHRDLPNERANYWGTAAIDELFFAVDEVTSHGQIVGAIVAKTKLQAVKAARLVNIEYEDLPVILTIEQAMEKQSFHPQYDRRIARGTEIEQALGESDFVLSGTTRMGGQEHFYLEVSLLSRTTRDSCADPCASYFALRPWQPSSSQRARAERLRFTARLKRSPRLSAGLHKSQASLAIASSRNANGSGAALAAKSLARPCSLRLVRWRPRS